MQITQTVVGDVTVLALSGKLDTHTSQDAQDSVTALIDSGAMKVLFDLKELSYISSIGFRVLLMAAKQLQRDGGALRICNITGNVKEVFDISGFATVFDIFDDEGTALADF